MTLTISVRSLAYLLLLAGTGPALLGVAIAGYGLLTLGDGMAGPNPAVGLRHAHDVPQWLLTALYFLSAALMLGHARVSWQSRSDRRAWLWLSSVFLLLSFDEGANFTSDLLEAGRYVVSPQLITDLLSTGLTGHLWLGLAATVLGLAAIALLQGACHLLVRLPGPLRWALGLVAAALLVAAPLQTWAGPARLWFALGGGEAGVALVRELPAVAATALEIAAVIAVVMALAAHARARSGTSAKDVGVPNAAGLGLP